MTKISKDISWDFSVTETLGYFVSLAAFVPTFIVVKLNAQEGREVFFCTFLIWYFFSGRLHRLFGNCGRSLYIQVSQRRLKQEETTLLDFMRWSPVKVERLMNIKRLREWWRRQQHYIEKQIRPGWEAVEKYSSKPIPLLVYIFRQKFEH